MSEQEIFNPLEKKHLGESIAHALLSRPAVPLDAIEPFNGVGIYAIYYTGDFSAYSRLKELNENGAFALPIYVGKASPTGGRKGFDASIDQELHKRLKDHAKSIRQTKNLNIADFYCRYLVLDSPWISLGEAALIEQYRPLWNSVLDGFGNHDPGGGRRKGMKPIWDVLHPGRVWAEKCGPRPETSADIMKWVKEYFRDK